MSAPTAAETVEPATVSATRALPGAATVAAAMTIAVASAAATMAAFDQHQTYVAALGAAAVLVLFLGIALASTKVAAAAAPTAMAAAVIGSWDPGTIAWGWTIAVGSGWYLALELAMTAIERRGGLRHTPAVTVRRQWETAVVIAVAAGSALVSFGLATIAPERDLTVRVAGVLVVLAAMVVAHRRLTG